MTISHLSGSGRIYLGAALDHVGVCGWPARRDCDTLSTGCVFSDFRGSHLVLCTSRQCGGAFQRAKPKSEIAYDRSVPSCRADVTFEDGSHSMCFRLKIENTTRRKLHNCEGWLESTDRFPNISPVKLFWTGGIGEFSVDLIKGVPRFLQVCRIHQSNRVIMATKNETWPIDSIDAFQPGQQYVFKIALKGDDSAETCFYSVRLDWTGNWTTAEMTHVGS